MPEAVLTICPCFICQVEPSQLLVKVTAPPAAAAAVTLVPVALNCWERLLVVVTWRIFTGAALGAASMLAVSLSACALAVSVTLAVGIRTAAARKATSAIRAAPA